MPTDTLHNHFEAEIPAERLFGTVEDDRIVFDGLSKLMQESQHGQRWDIRDFEDDALGLLRIDRAFIPIIEGGTKSQEAAADWSQFLIEEESFIELQKGIESVYARSDVSTHLQNGGTLAFALAPHLSYADESVAMGAAAQLGPEIAQNQTGFIHRQVMLDEIRGVPDEDGNLRNLKVVDDGLLLVGNVIQTLPDSPSGRHQVFEPYREDINAVVQTEIDKILDRGNHTLWIASSGTEAKFDPVTGKYVVGMVTRNNARLFYLYNARGANKVMTVPLTFEINPFAEEGGLQPHKTPFAFGEPRIMYKKQEVHNMMQEQIAVMNSIKRDSTPPFRYETDEEFIARLGKKP